MKKIYTFGVLLLALNASNSISDNINVNQVTDGSSLEQHLESNKDHNCNGIIDVSVNGLVCDFCAQSLEKVFEERDDVAGIDVDLDNGKVTIETSNQDDIDDETLNKLITDSGYNLVAINKRCH